MSKSIISIILIILISYSLSFIPLNKELINLEFIDNIFSQGNNSSENENIDADIPDSLEYSFYTNEESNFLEDPILIKVIMETNDLTYDLEDILIIDIYANQTLVKSFENNELAIDIYITENTASKFIKFTLDISTSNTELLPGEYTFQIYPKDPLFNNKDLAFTVDYLNELNYVGSSNSAKTNFEYIKLYFADDSVNFLIPISRLIPVTEKDIRSTINSLYEGPKENIGLTEGPISPWPYKAYVFDGILDVYLRSSDVKMYSSGSSIATFAVDSLVQSLTSIQGIDTIQFYIDEKIPTGDYDYFHGMVLDEPIKPLYNPKLYFGLNTSDNYVYLTEFTIYNHPYTDIFNLLNGSYDYANDGNLSHLLSNDNVVFPIPYNVELLDISLSDKVLTLNINRNALEAFGTFNKNYQLMIDSILYSYTSFKEIESVQILFSGEKISDFYGYDLSKPIKANKYINIEQ